MSDETRLALTGRFRQDGYCEPGSDSENTELDLLVKNVTFVVTERCNLACTYCYETHKQIIE